ncbi:MAG: hypothetical protein Q8L14_41500 [Myxococcales bacterium]|nr:hypothetical protein [Myxococcales bacterium]
MRLTLAMGLLVVACDAEVAAPPVATRLDAVTRTVGASPGARYGTSLASCAGLNTGAPGRNSIYSNTSELPLGFSGAGSAVACVTTNVATVAPDAGAIVFTNLPPLTDAGTFNLIEASIALATTSGGLLVAVGTPLERCLNGTCTGGVLVWQVSSSVQVFRAALRPDAGIGLGADVALGRFIGTTNYVFAAAPGAPSPMIIDTLTPSLSPLVGLWPGVTAIELATLPGADGGTSFGLVLGQPMMSRAVGIVPQNPGAPRTTSWDLRRTVSCAPDAGVGTVVAAGDFDSDLIDDVALSNPDTNTVAVGLSGDLYRCITVPTPVGLGATAAFGKALAFRGVGTTARLVVGAPGAEGGTGAVFEFSLCEVLGNCPGTDGGAVDGDAGVVDAGVDAGVVDAGGPADAGAVDPSDAGAALDAGPLPDAGPDGGDADGGPALTFIPACGCTDAPGSFSLAALALMLTLRRWTRRT